MRRLDLIWVNLASKQKADIEYLIGQLCALCRMVSNRLPVTASREGMCLTPTAFYWKAGMTVRVVSVGLGVTFCSMTMKCER